MRLTTLPTTEQPSTGQCGERHTAEAGIGAMVPDSLISKLCCSLSYGALPRGLSSHVLFRERGHGAGSTGAVER